MNVAVIGTGFIGGTLGRALANAGHEVTFGSRHPDNDDVVGVSSATVTSTQAALEAANVIILAVPGTAVSEFPDRHRDALSGKLIIDATNRMGEPVANSRSALPETIRYAPRSILWAAKTWPTRSSTANRLTCFFRRQKVTGQRLKK